MAGPAARSTEACLVEATEVSTALLEAVADSGLLVNADPVADGA